MAGVPSSSRSSSSGTGVTELAYAEWTSAINITATAIGTANTIVSAGAVVYTGVRICIEFYCPFIETGNSATGIVRVILHDGTNPLGEIAKTRNVAAAFLDTTVLARRFVAAPSGSLTYSIRAYREVVDGTAAAGLGGAVAGTALPGYIRVTSGG